MRKNITGGAATVTRSMIRTCQAAKSATMFAAEPATGIKRAHLATFNNFTNAGYIFKVSTSITGTNAQALAVLISTTEYKASKEKKKKKKLNQVL